MIRQILLVASLIFATPATAQILGSDAAACTSRIGPAIQVAITGLKDRKGDLKLELYPATEADFLKDDRDLIAEGKMFRRVRIPTPAYDPTTMCIRVPRPGQYALLFSHDRDGRNKFNFWSDGVGFASNRKLGRSRPKLEETVVSVGRTIATVTIRAQYLRGLGGFGPVKAR